MRGQRKREIVLGLGPQMTGTNEEEKKLGTYEMRKMRIRFEGKKLGEKSLAICLATYSSMNELARFFILGHTNTRTRLDFF